MSNRTQLPNLIIAWMALAIIESGPHIGCSESIHSTPKNLVSDSVLFDKSITLQETPHFVLQEPLCVTVSPSGQRIAITDRTTGHLLVFEAATGRLITTYHAGADLIDSVADAMSSWPFKHIDSTGAALLHTSEVLDERGKVYTPEKLSRDFPNRMRLCLFRNDTTILMLAELNGIYRRIENGRSIQGSFPNSAIVEFGIESGRVTVRPSDDSKVDWSHVSYPQLDAFVRRTATGTFLVSCLYSPENKISDVRPLLEVDGNWNEIRRLGALPPALRNWDLMDFMCELAIVDIPGTNRVLAAFKKLPYIYDFQEGTSFPLHTMGDNQEYLNRLVKWRKNASSIHDDSVFAAWRFDVQNLEWMGGDSILVVLLHRGEGKDSLLVLGQEYRTNGEFLRSYKIADAQEDQPLPRVTYSRALNRIVAVNMVGETWKASLFRSPR